MRKVIGKTDKKRLREQMLTRTRDANTKTRVEEILSALLRTHTELIHARINAATCGTNLDLRAAGLAETLYEVALEEAVQQLVALMKSAGENG